MSFIVTQKAALIKLFLGTLILAGGVYLICCAWPQPVLPALPPEPDPLPEIKLAETTPILQRKDVPRRDPFRPLNHPAADTPAGAVSVRPAARSSGPEAEKSVRPVYRLTGILSVNGKRKALIARPGGSMLAETGSALPGIGTIEAIGEQDISCSVRNVALGEEWS